MKFSRFEFFAIIFLTLIIAISTGLSLLFGSVDAKVNDFVKTNLFEPALADEQSDLALPELQTVLEPQEILKKIEVNLSEQKMYLYENETLVNEFVISSGKARTPTPEGNFEINNKVDLAYSNRYRMYMPKWQAFIGSKYGIHGLPYTKRGKRITWIEGQTHLGTPVSHGCIRLSWDDALRLFEWSSIGIQISIHN